MDVWPPHEDEIEFFLFKSDDEESFNEFFLRRSDDMESFSEFCLFKSDDDESFNEFFLCNEFLEFLLFKSSDDDQCRIVFSARPLGDVTTLCAELTAACDAIRWTLDVLVWR